METGAGGMPPGPARSSRPWNFRVSLSPAPTQPQRCCPTWPASSSPHAPSGPMSPPRSRPWRVAHPHVPGPDHTCPGSGVPAAVLALTHRRILPLHTIAATTSSTTHSQPRNYAQPLDTPHRGSQSRRSPHRTQQPTSCALCAMSQGRSVVGMTTGLEAPSMTNTSSLGKSRP